MSAAGEAAFREFLEESTGFQIPDDRWRYLAPRFLARLEGRGFSDVPEYIDYLQHNPLGRTEVEEIFWVLTVRSRALCGHS